MPLSRLTVQEIFSLAISLNYYRDVGKDQFMCFALETMLAQEIITKSEMLEAEKEINDYTGGFYTLRNRLEAVGLPSQFEDRLTIYTNWDDKPKLIKQELTMKFDLPQALAGQPVVLRNGAKAFVRHHETELSTLYTLFGYLEGTDKYNTATWAADGHSYVTSGFEGDDDIVGMWIEPAVFNHWDALEPRWKYIAADEDGDVSVFTIKPDKSETFWANGCDEFVGFMTVTDLFNFQYTDWEHSLVERPSKE